MPAKRNRPKCECGCGQAPARTTRMRLVVCDCGYTVRVTREWLEHGAPLCPQHGPMRVPCLYDRCRLPGGEGERAWGEYTGRAAQRVVLSERAVKAAAARKRRKAAGFYVAAADLPF